MSTPEIGKEGRRRVWMGEGMQAPIPSQSGVRSSRCCPPSSESAHRDYLIKCSLETSKC